MGDSEGVAPLGGVEAPVTQRKSVERLAKTGEGHPTMPVPQRQSVDRLAKNGEGGTTSPIPQRQSVERLAKNEDLPDVNLNYEIREMPKYNPNLEEEFFTANRPAAGIRSAAAELPELMPELFISDDATKQPAGIELPMRAAAGISSNARHYKMASDIFGTGMDRSWNDEEPWKPAELSAPAQARKDASMERHRNEKNERNDFDFKVPEQPLARNRNEPGSFKITETASENPSEPNVDFAIGSSAARKARESSGNPLTGQGYNDDAGAKTAKRYYQGSNANSKLW